MSKWKTEQAVLDRDIGWKRHPDLYMEDGSVVLLADNTLFRVYLKWLGKKSEIFAQMAAFDNVQPSNAEIYDGCPLIHLSDSAADLECFLSAMDGCSSYFSPNKPTPFQAVAGILRLASKYMVMPLQEKAIDHLCRIFPTKFEDMTIEHKALRKKVFGPPSASLEHPILLVNLVRSCHVTKLLPWAYYSVIRWSFRDMVLGHETSAGDIVRLSDGDMQKCLIGFEKLMTMQHANIKEIFSGPSLKCETKGSCGEGINDAYIRALEEHGTGLIAPLGPLRRKIEACERCLAHIKHVDTVKRKQTWQNLPSVFDLPPWVNLLGNDHN